MSKQSKQERAKKYAEGARECVRLANVAADEMEKRMGSLRTDLHAVSELIVVVRDWQGAAKNEAANLDATLASLSEQRSIAEKSIADLTARVEGAKGTIKETAERLKAVYRESNDAPAETTTPAVESA